MPAADPLTEQRHPGTVNIDLEPSAKIIRSLLNEDAVAIEAAQLAAPAITDAVDRALSRTLFGGAIHYFGAGASGRLAILDATEVTPTFGMPREFFVPHFPGGESAFLDSDIDLEDAETLGYDDAASVAGSDVAVGISASGATAYVQGALRRSHEAGALTILITCNPGSMLEPFADIAIVADTGAEALTGSTRLKAGTATKVILNAFSTTLMIRSGKTYSNLMVELVATNKKLRKRALLILEMATEQPPEDCAQALDECGGELPTALARLLTGSEISDCRDAVRDGGVRHAIELLH